MKPTLRLTAPILACLLAACAGTPGTRASTQPVASATAGPATAVADIDAARQLILVLTPDWDATRGRLQRFERDDRGWRPVGEAFDISVGRTGLAWGEGLHAPQPGLQKREGDGRAPAGRFRIGPAFGYAGDDDTALPYLAMREAHYCMDVPTSPHYNRIVDAAKVGADAVAGSTEPMRLDLHNAGDARYRLGFVIEHNPRARPGAGSCIFAHLWKAPGAPTAGCTAMSDQGMRDLLDWLRPDRQPVFVQLPRAEYQRLRADWRLPETID